MTSHSDVPLLLAHAAPIEDALRGFMETASQGGLPLYRMMQYQLGWVDKDGQETSSQPPPRGGGSLCAEVAHALGTTSNAYDAAAAIELFVGSVDCHEQMQSGEAGPPERPAVWWVWGPAQAINVGDGLHALARLAMMRLRDNGLPTDATLACVDVLDGLALRYYEGQYIELTYQERVDVTQAQYSKMARSKRGALIGGACALGAAVAGADKGTRDALDRLGTVMGEAAQVKDDLDSLFEKSPLPDGRLLNKSKLYPVVEVLEHGSLAQKRAVGTIYFKRVMEPADVEELRRLLEEAGVRQRSEARLHDLVAGAKAASASIPALSAGGSRWERIIDEVVGIG